MITATRSVAVVATRLPLIDRRTLSEAWYSALHVVQSAPSTVAARSGGRVASTAPSTAPRARDAASPSAVHPSRVAPQHLPARRAATAIAVDRRTPASDLSRRIERAIAARTPGSAARCATVAITAGAGRITLLVRTSGDVTRVVALCAPHVRERVDRALAHARFALAAHGTRVEVSER